MPNLPLRWNTICGHSHLSHFCRIAGQTILWQREQLIHDDVLVNLQAQHPPFFSRFRRLIEIVGVDEEDKAAARIRYRFYRDRGYEIKSFDVMGNAL